jgi:hypothetical protein
MKNNIQEVINYLKIITINWLVKIEFGIKTNTPIGVEIGKTDYEVLSCLFYDIKGTGKSSGDNDHDNGDETKGANKIRPKTCSCGKICHFFLEKCSCGSSTFDYSDDELKTDVRWGIDTNAHFRYGVPNYHLWILEAKEYSASNRTFLFTLYKINGENKHFNEILKVQNESKSKSKNFIPYSKDFYASEPNKMATFEITLNENGNIITHLPLTDLSYTKQILSDKRNLGKYLPSTFVPVKDNYLYEEIESLINVRKFKTAHDKERGYTKRRSE